MDINDLRAVLTVASFLAFVAIALWAWSRRAKPGFDRAARSVIEEDRDDGRAAK
jgi:cytochrome c oxidase cbb3-type subunit 4